MAARRPGGGKPPKATGGRPIVYTGRGAKGTGRGFHGKPGKSTGMAKGAGYHGKPPGGVKPARVVGSKPPRPAKATGGKPPVFRKKRVGKLPTRTAKAPRGARGGR